MNHILCPTVFTQFASGWKKSTLLRITCLRNSRIVKLRYSFAYPAISPYCLHSLTRGIIPIITTRFTLSVVHSLLIRLQICSHFIHVSVRNLDGRNKSGEGFRKISFEKRPLSKRVSGHHMPLSKTQLTDCQIKTLTIFSYCVG